MDQDTPTIYDTARICSKLFEQNLETLDNGSAKFLLAEELHGRFNLWAAYIGAFAAPRASLDARLISHEDVKGMVLELLEMVQENLEWELILTSEPNDQMQRALGSKGDEIYEELSGVTPGLGAAETAIDRLFMLAVEIRRSARRTQKLRHRATDEQAESLCYLLVQSRFRQARSSLCSQLGASIHTRGTSLQYLQMHNKKLSYQRETQSGFQKAAEDDDEPENNLAGPGGSIDNPTPRGRQTITEPETLPSLVSPSAVVRLKKTWAKPSGSIISRGSTVQDFQRGQFYYPPKPQREGEKRYQPCTLCAEPLEISALTEDTWKAHVDQDLEPYVCISEECREPLHYFVRMRDWMDHMQTWHTMTWAQKIHTERWYCNVGHSDPLEFDDKGPFLAHLKAEHGKQLTKSQLLGRARRNRRMATRDPFVCPLCDCVPDDIEPYIKEKPYKQLSEHIAQHLKSLAFLSLSYVEDDSKDKQSVAESSDENSDKHDARISRASLTNRNLDSFRDIPETKISQDGTRNVDGQEFPDTPTLLNKPEDWTFVPVKIFQTDFELLKEQLTNPEREMSGDGDRKDFVVGHDRVGDSAEAVQLPEQVEAFQKTTLADDDPGRLSSQHELAVAYLAKGQIKEAVQLLEHVVAVQKTTLADGHPDPLSSQHALATAYLADGQIKEAVQLLEHVVAVRKMTLADDHPDRLASQQELARAYQADGQVKGASDTFDHSAAMDRQEAGAKPPVDSKSKHVRTPLWVAAKSGDVALVKLLVERDDVEADSKDDDDQTPLWIAASRGHAEVVKLLVERDDVEPDRKNKYGQTPLWEAAWQGHAAVVKLLVERDDVKADSKDDDGQTPLWVAASRGHAEVVKLLVERDDVEADSKNKHGRTPLREAAWQGHAEVVKLLLERDDIEADSKNMYGRTPLWEAAWQGHAVVAKLLVERDDVTADSKDKSGRTPLWIAASRGHEKVVKLLVERSDVTVNIKDMRGQTPAEVAVAQGHEAVVALLLEHSHVETDLEK